MRPEENTFEAIMVDVTHRCNMECANCYLPNREIPDMDKDKLLDFCSRLPSRTWIRLIGAEPTMRDDLCEIISEVKALGHRVSLTTNGLKLHREEYVQSLKDAGLKYVLLSMNGADDDDVYKILDNGKYAKVKVKALENLAAGNFIVNTGTIISKNINEHIIRTQYDLISKYKFKVKPVLRFRAVAPLGRYMGESNGYILEELIGLASAHLGVSRDYIEANKAEVYNNFTGFTFEMPHAFIRLVDWQEDEDNESRGRVTQDFTIAPFFEHVKENEGGY